MINRLEVIPLIRIDNYSSLQNDEPHFGAGSSDGVNEARFKISPAEAAPWGFSIQAIDFSMFTSESVTWKSHDGVDLFVISYGGNVIFGNSTAINSLINIDTGGCLLLSLVCKDTKCIIFGFKKLILIDSSGKINEMAHNLQSFESFKLIDDEKFSIIYSFRGHPKSDVYDLCSDGELLIISPDS